MKAKEENVFRRIADYVRVYGQYFREDKTEITRSNLINLQLINAAAIVITIILMLISPALIRGWHVTGHYYLLIPLEIVFFVIATIGRISSKGFKPITVEILCAAFHFLLMMSFIFISVFTYPNTPQIFITCSFFLIPTVLIQRLPVMFWLTAFCETLFLVLAYRHKTPYCFGHDTFNTVASILFATAVLGATMRLRIRDYDTRRRFQKLSQIDQLTGLTGKIPFEVMCEHKCLSKEAPENCALLFIDLDNFKQINDQYGHLCGDAVLRDFSQKLKAAFGQENNVIGRIGGDEFAVFLPKASNKKELIEKMSVLCKEANLLYSENTINYSCSIGAARSNTHDFTYKELVRHADKALYKVKDNFKNNFFITDI